MGRYMLSIGPELLDFETILIYPRRGPPGAGMGPGRERVTLGTETADRRPERVPGCRARMTMNESEQQRLIVGISGASGVVYGIRLLQILGDLPVETHLVMSRAAEMTISYETERKPLEVKRLSDVCHAVTDIGASISSGSFRTRGMAIAPCSVRTMSEIATGMTTTLLTRAADVVLKERRRLVLLVRETPLHTGHLRTMLQLAEMGAVVMPPVPAFYAKPDSIEAMIDQTLGRMLDLFDLDAGVVRRWGVDLGAAPAARKDRPAGKTPE